MALPHFHAVIDPGFHGRARAYLLQSALATGALAAILLVETGVTSAAISASIASSVFLVFVVPHSVASSTRRIIGGHVVGVLVGAAGFGVLKLIFEDATEISTEAMAIAGACSVGASILAMAITKTEHPPSAGTALGLVTLGSSYQAVWFILSAALILGAVRLALRRWLVNLL